MNEALADFFSNRWNEFQDDIVRETGQRFKDFCEIFGELT
jgi:hypothetical protein